jgi:hypothetical protein
MNTQASDPRTTSQPAAAQQFRMVPRNGPPIAMNCPFFLCAVCSAPVYAVPSPEHNLDGYVLWWAHYEPGDGREHQLGPFIVHRLACMLELERRVEAMGHPWFRFGPYSQPFSEVLDQLAYNARHPLGTGREDDPGYPHRAEYVAPYPSRWRAGHFPRRRPEPEDDRVTSP